MAGAIRHTLLNWGTSPGLAWSPFPSAGFSWVRPGACTGSWEPEPGLLGKDWSMRRELGAGTCLLAAPGVTNPRVYTVGIGPSFDLCLRLSTHPFHCSRKGCCPFGGEGISTFPSGSFCLPRFGATVLAAQSFLVTGVEGSLFPSNNPVQSLPPWVTGSGI